MEVPFTAEQEAQLGRIAIKSGTDALCRTSCNSPHLRLFSDRERAQMAFWIDALFLAPEPGPKASPSTSTKFSEQAARWKKGLVWIGCPRHEF
jgi:hypothetical protein